MAVEGTKTNLYITPIILVMRQLPLLASAAAMALGAIFATIFMLKE